MMSWFSKALILAVDASLIFSQITTPTLAETSKEEQSQMEEEQGNGSNSESDSVSIAEPEEYDVETGLYYREKTEAIQITGWDNSEDEDLLIIPDEIAGKKVTEIGDYAFEKESGLKTIDLGENVSWIGREAFADCIGLEKVLIRNLDLDLDETAFTGCDFLKTVQVSSSLIKELLSEILPQEDLQWVIGFEDEEKDTKPVVPQKLPQLVDTPLIPEGETADSSNVDPDSNMDVQADPETVVAEGTCGETLTWALTQEGLLIIEGSGKMNDYTASDTPWYAYKSQINSIRFSEDLTSIGNNAFYQCTSLTGELQFPSSLETIGANAFYQDQGLTGNLLIPDSVTYISSSAFQSCSGMTGTLSLGSNLKTIGQSAFDGTGFSGEIVLPDSVTTVNNYAFSHMPNLESFVCNEGLKTIQRIFIYSKSLKRFEIKSSDFMLYTYPFEGVSSLETIVLPDDNFSKNVIKLYDYAYTTDSAIVQPASKPDFLIQDDVLIGYFGDETDVHIPENVSEIGSYAFKNRKIRSVSFPDSVLRIDNSAFHNCTSLTGPLALPNQLTSIGERAFQNCTSLQGPLVIPDLVEKIGTYAFNYCSAMNGRIVLPENLTALERYVLPEGTNVEELEVRCAHAKIEFSEIAHLNGLQKITFRASDIGGYK